MRRSFLVALLVVLPVEAAKQSAIPNRYGAIAYDEASRSWGISYNKAQARDASLEALKQCGKRQCIVVHKFRNGCAALAEGSKGMAAVSGTTRDEAETKALKRCGADCTATAWACTR